MRLYQLLSNKVAVPFSNEETDFMKRHGAGFQISRLEEHDEAIARQLINKNAYTLGEDSDTATNNVYANPGLSI